MSSQETDRRKKRELRHDLRTIIIYLTGFGGMLLTGLGLYLAIFIAMSGPFALQNPNIDEMFRFIAIACPSGLALVASAFVLNALNQQHKQKQDDQDNR